MSGMPRHSGRHGESPLTVADLLGRGSGPDDTTGGAAASGSRIDVPRRAVVPAQRSGPGGPPPHRARPGRSPRLLGSAAAVGVVAAGIVVVAVWRPSGAAAAGGARMDLTTPEVQIGRSYRAGMSGFASGEQVRVTWTGPTSGVMGAFTADESGQAEVRGPIVERDPPGDYRIIATGLRSGFTASAPLRVTDGGRAPGQGQ